MLTPPVMTTTQANSNYWFNPQNFPRMSQAQNPNIFNVPNVQNADLMEKLNSMDDKLNEKIETVSSNIQKIETTVEHIKKSYEEQEKQICGLNMENKVLKQRITEHEEMLKEIFVPFCEDLLKFCNEKNTKQCRVQDETFKSHLEIYKARLSKINVTKQIFK
ncbi:unnamed protein product [Didymodactylos carnosus]|uniref:Uncharacterized protein n=1 Tax=Didymodactylos carnosus TaxID=1234261 RepID=A0A8S2E5D4_9BILA|nr:unnamed protein product [Didymodactylos carnosus]CAF3927377.1 unnamed protein product [Didymodactylos carnosus]